MAPTQVQRDLAFGDAGFARLGLYWQDQLGVQHFQGAAPEHGQSAVRRHAANRLVVVKVVTELGHVGVVLVLAVGQLAFEEAFVPKPFAQGLHQGRVFGPALTEQIAYTVEHRSGACEVGPFNGASGQQKGLRFGMRVECGVGKQLVGQGLQPGFAGDHALGAALGLERQINVFQLLFGGRSIDGG